MEALINEIKEHLEATGEKSKATQVKILGAELKRLQGIEVTVDEIIKELESLHCVTTVALIKGKYRNAG